MAKLSVFTVMYRLLISCFSLFFNYLAPSSLLLIIEHNESHIANYLRPLFFMNNFILKPVRFYGTLRAGSSSDHQFQFYVSTENITTSPRQELSAKSSSVTVKSSDSELVNLNTKAR